MCWLLRRWWTWTTAAVTATVLIAAGLLIAVGGSRITEANCDRIVNGMTLEEVEALLGSPPRELELQMIADGVGDHLPARWFFGYCWMDDDDNRIDVYFMTEDAAADMKAYRAEFTKGDLPLQERLRRLVRKVLRL